MALELEGHVQDNRVSISLQPSEQSLLAAASRIFAARIVAGQCSSDNEVAEMKAAIVRAIQMARIIDDQVRADAER
jgi:hypothetical protein